MTVAVPVAGKEFPTPLSMLMLLASVTLQVRVELAPGAIASGFAVNVMTGVTAMVTDFEVVPPGPVAVAV